MNSSDSLRLKRLHILHSDGDGFSTPKLNGKALLNPTSNHMLSVAKRFIPETNEFGESNDRIIWSYAREFTSRRANSASAFDIADHANFEPKPLNQSIPESAPKNVITPAPSVTTVQAPAKVAIPKTPRYDKPAKLALAPLEPASNVMRRFSSTMTGLRVFLATLVTSKHKLLSKMTDAERNHFIHILGEPTAQIVAPAVSVETPPKQDVAPQIVEVLPVEATVENTVENVMIDKESTAQIANLEAQIKAKSEQIAMLEKANADLAAKLSSLEHIGEGRKVLEDQRTHLEAKVADITKQNEHLGTENQRLAEENAHLGVERQKLTEANEKFKSMPDPDALKAEIMTMKQMLADAENRVRNVGVENSEFANQNAHLNERIAELIKSLREGSAYNSHIEGEIKRLKDELQTSKTKAEQLQAQLDNSGHIGREKIATPTPQTAPRPVRPAPQPAPEPVTPAPQVAPKPTVLAPQTSPKPATLAPQAAPKPFASVPKPTVSAPKPSTLAPQFAPKPVVRTQLTPVSSLVSPDKPMVTAIKPKAVPIIPKTVPTTPKVSAPASTGFDPLASFDKILADLENEASRMETRITSRADTARDDIKSKFGSYDLKEFPKS